jgi:hypothetical protein
MPFPNNCPRPQDLPDLPPQEIAALPAAVLATLQQETEAAVKQARAAKSRLDAALVLKYGARDRGPRRRRQGHRHGALRRTTTSPWSPTCRSGSTGTRRSSPRWSSASAPPATIPASTSTSASRCPSASTPPGPTAIRQGFEPARTVRPGALKVEILPQGGRSMSLRIITADERLREAQGKTTMALFGPSGGARPRLVKTLPAEETVCLDLEAGLKSVQDWPATACRSAASPMPWTSPA